MKVRILVLFTDTKSLINICRMDSKTNMVGKQAIGLDGLSSNPGPTTSQGRLGNGDLTSLCLGFFAYNMRVKIVLSY